MRVLDLFCGAGGAGYGYHLAGFEVVGFDIKRRQCGYPAGEFVKADVRDVLADRSYLRSFDLVHASPPCQTFSRTKHLRDAQGKSTSKLDMVDEVRDALEAAGVPYVLENVEGSPLRPDLLLCGSMFPWLSVEDETGRRWLKRHRIFESNLPLHAPCGCRHKVAGVRPLGVYGSKGDDIPSGGQTCRTLEQAQSLMGMPWASWAGIVEAIPPAYTEWIGEVVAPHLRARGEVVAA